MICFRASRPRSAKFSHPITYLLTAGSAWQLVRGARLSLPGMARLDMEPPAALAVLTGALALVAAFGAVALAPFAFASVR